MKIYEQSEQVSFKRLYLLVGILGALLPILDVWKCGWKIPPSISESYYLGAIVPFTCILFATGVIFFCNDGFDGRDKICNRISGVAAIGVVCFPCDSPKYLFWFIPFPAMHYISAAIFFGVLGYMSGFVFTRLRNRYKGWTNNKYYRNYIYILCSVCIYTCMILAATKVIPIVYAEWLMIWAYVIAYIIQGEIILKD